MDIHKSRFFKRSAPSLIILLAFVFTLPDFSYAKILSKQSSGQKGSKTAPGAKEEPIIINGDNVEYSADNKIVTASGNVSVTSKGAKLTCDKMTINVETKDAEAVGHVRLENKKGVIEGKQINYNFEKKDGVISDADFRANPYFGSAKKMDKINDNEFITYRGSMSSCSFDHPHYRMNAKKMDYFPQDKVSLKNITFTAGQYKQIPLFYLPFFNENLNDNFWKLQMMPGHKKDWGYFLLTAWRFNLSDNIKGNILLDERSNFGIAEGFTTQYDTKQVGTGNLKFYYTQERDKSNDIDQKDVSLPKVFQRYLLRWRHKWDIDKSTNFLTEYYKIVDSKRALMGPNFNFLKDYFPREYDRDPQPLSYAQLHHSFTYSGLDILFQKRTNPWYAELEKLPEAKYSLPSSQIAQTPFFFEDSSIFAKYVNKQPVPSSSVLDTRMGRLYSLNKFSMPTKASIFRLTPFVGTSETYYNADINGASIAPRTVFLAGSDISTKFYRVFNVKSNLWGININGLRHVFNPVATYNYNHAPTISSSHLKQIDSIDAINTSNTVALGIYNKLQTHRSRQSVDLVDFRVDSSYQYFTVAPATNIKTKGHLIDLTTNLDVRPYTWMTLHSDAVYSTRLNYFKDVNADLNINLDREHSFGFGQRYERKGSKEMTFTSQWRLTPKWKMGIYTRFLFTDQTNIDSGFRETQYTLTRDLHCWDLEVSFDEEHGKGSTFWIIFRLKAFPEIGFDLHKQYHTPKPGSQSTI